MSDTERQALLNAYSFQILSAAIVVHREMGPGLLESVYHHCMVKELRSRGMLVHSMVELPLTYKGESLTKSFVVDIVVEQQVIVELKSVDAIHPLHEAQIISYLKLSDLNLGLLINFNVPVLKSGIKRFVNKF